MSDEIRPNPIEVIRGLIALVNCMLPEMVPSQRRRLAADKRLVAAHEALRNENERHNKAA